MKKHSSDRWKVKRRVEFRELTGVTHYIFCEGIKTEPNYFRSFEKLIKSSAVYRKTVHIHVSGLGKETLRILNNAQDFVRNEKITTGEIWCVFDKDDFSDDAFNAVTNKINQLNTNAKDSVRYHSIWSNECFEFWFLLHFENLTSNISRKDYIAKLNDYIPCRYGKNIENIFDVLLECNGDPKKAARFARRIIDENKGVSPSQIAPGTKVHELVLELARYLPEEIKGRFLDD